MNPTKNDPTHGERKVAAVLSMYGHTVEQMPSTWPHFDLLMDGKIKIEVKTSRPSINHTYPRNKLIWFFNVQRHSKINENGFDFYIFRFEGIPGSKKAIHALFYPPLESPTITFSERQLLEGAIAGGVKAFRGLNLKKKMMKAEEKP